MATWSFLTNHARALICIAHDPGVRLREIAAALDITERSAYAIVTDLAEAGYVVKEKEGRRNRYQIQGHLPLRESIARERTIGEVLEVLVKAGKPAEKDVPVREPGTFRTLPAWGERRWSAAAAAGRTERPCCQNM
jgi:DNA-binding transcriptional ArsR family regulator